MVKVFVTALLAAGLLASGDACGWLCGGAATNVQNQAADSHCSGASSERAPDEQPSHEDCPGCTLDVGANSLALVAAGGESLFARPTLSVLSARFDTRGAPGLWTGLAPPRVDRAPPRDVRSLTTTLLI